MTEKASQAIQTMPSATSRSGMTALRAARPWYKEFYVWIVIGGPVSAMLACAVTAVYILQGPDAVVSENYYKEGLALAKEVSVAQPAMQPAKTGRNYSATGGDVKSKSNVKSNPNRNTDSEADAKP